MMILATGVALLLAAAQGDAEVVDGDTLMVAGTAVQLKGIDLPASPDVIPQTAAEHLRELVSDSVVSCRLTGERHENLMLGTCRADGEDIGATLVAHGMALDCERYSGGLYRHLEPEGLRDLVEPSSHCRD